MILDLAVLLVEVESKPEHVQTLNLLEMDHLALEMIRRLVTQKTAQSKVSHNFIIILSICINFEIKLQFHLLAIWELSVEKLPRNL